MRPLLIGQAPAKYSEGLPALCGLTGRHLASLAGLSPTAFAAAVETRNLLDYYPGPAASGNGDAFPLSEARDAALGMLPELTGRRVVLCGRLVAVAFKLHALPPLEWHTVHGSCSRGEWEFEVAVVPHPSTVNRWWNDYANRRAAARFLRDLLGVAEPEPEPLRLTLDAESDPHHAARQ